MTQWIWSWWYPRKTTIEQWKQLLQQNDDEEKTLARRRIPHSHMTIRVPRGDMSATPKE